MNITGSTKVFCILKTMIFFKPKQNTMNKFKLTLSPEYTKTPELESFIKNVQELVDSPKFSRHEATSISEFIVDMSAIYLHLKLDQLRNPITYEVFKDGVVVRNFFNSEVEFFRVEKIAEHKTTGLDSENISIGLEVRKMLDYFFDSKKDIEKQLLKHLTENKTDAILQDSRQLNIVIEKIALLKFIITSAKK